MDNTQKNEHLLKMQEKWINFTYDEIKNLFTYYIIVMIVSFLWMILSLMYHYELSKDGFSNIVGISMFSFPSGILGATIYYIRKLYKSCIQELIKTDLADDNPCSNFKKIGAKMYFYLRPIISGILAVLINIAIIAGVCFVNNQPDINNDKFFFFVILISFYVGFCNGKLIINMEKNSENFAGLVTKTKEKK